ncbi:MAG TPA: hypothetical protein VLO10_07380 [Candidatus Deferrimicrobium sp.]|nr:hypothetical protein [Candidatus Deferrimicrobium sp.]
MPTRRAKPAPPAGDRALLEARWPATQANSPHHAPPGWRPTFFDYLYVSLTNATAFSPTDTMPLTRKAKGPMGVQCLASLLTVALVAGRAVNILT